MSINTTTFSAMSTQLTLLKEQNKGLKNIITKSLQEYETLKSDFILIENTFQSLLTIKKQIIHFDGQHLKKINKNLQLKKVYVLVKNTFNKIQWDKLLTVTNFNRYADTEYCYEDQIYFSNEEQIPLKKIADKKVYKVKSQMKLIISNLEAIPGMITKGFEV